MKWPIKVIHEEEGVWISLLVSISLVILTILFLWIWPDIFGNPDHTRKILSSLGD